MTPIVRTQFEVTKGPRPVVYTHLEVSKLPDANGKRKGALIDMSDHASAATLTSLIACRELVRECVAPFTKVDDPGG